MASKLKTKLAFASVMTAVAAGGAVYANSFYTAEAASEIEQAVNRAEKTDRLVFKRVPQTVSRADKGDVLPASYATAEPIGADPLTTASIRPVTIDGPDFGDVVDPAPATTTAVKTGPIDGPDFGDVEDAATSPAETAELRTGPIDGPDFGDVEDAPATPVAAAAETTDTAKPSRKRTPAPRTVAAEPKRGPMVIIPGYADATPDGPSAIVPSTAPAPAQRSTNVATDPSDTPPVK